MNFADALIFFLYGSLTGSFLNVCAYRIPRGESVIRPRSRCITCGKQIWLVDNLPIVSYLILGGRCRHCSAKISIKYLVVEIITAVLWVVLYYHFGLSVRFFYSLFFITLLIMLSAIDYEKRVIPNKILAPAMIVSISFLLLYFGGMAGPLLIGTSTNALLSIIGFIAGGVFMLVAAMLAPLILKKDAIGGGDIKLTAFIGLYLGGYVFIALFIAFLASAVFGITLIAVGKKNIKDSIPFGPSLAIGSIVTIFLGPQLLQAYLKIAGL